MKPLELELRIIRRRLVLVPTKFRDSGFTVCFTTRVGLEPGGPKFVNYGFYGKSGAAGNRSALIEGLGFEPGRLTAGYQTHSANVRIVDEALAGRGGMKAAGRIPETDGLATNLDNTPLMVATADCVPVILLDPRTPAAAAVHAGWRGALSGVIEEAVKTMRKTFGAKPEDIQALIGPCIGQCCYEIGLDVANLVPPKRRDAVLSRGDSLYLDLRRLSAGLLAESGVVTENIHAAELCTSCRTELFYSYRADKNRPGSNASIVAIAP